MCEFEDVYRVSVDIYTYMIMYDHVCLDFLVFVVADFINYVLAMSISALESGHPPGQLTGSCASSDQDLQFESQEHHHGGQLAGGGCAVWGCW